MNPSTTTVFRRRLFDARASEAAALIQKLVDSGMTPEEIAEASRVAERTVYRWWKEGRAPHPLLLDALRKLAIKKGIEHDVHL